MLLLLRLGVESFISAELTLMIIFKEAAYEKDDHVDANILLLPLGSISMPWGGF